MQKRRVLIVSSRIPYPDTAGDKKRILAFSRIIKKAGNDVHLLALGGKCAEFDALVERNARPDGAWFDAIDTVSIGKARMLLNMAIAILTGKALQERIYYSPSFMKELRKRADRGGYDTVVWYHVRLLPYIEALSSSFKAKCIVDLVDSIAYHYLAAERQSSWFWRLIYGYEGVRVKKAERTALRLCDRAWITSQADKDFIDPENPRLKTIPMGVEDRLLDYTPSEKRNAVCFIGKMNYNPNVDAVRFFAEKVLPGIKNPDFRFYILGTSPSRAVLDLAKKDPRVIVTGFIPDPYVVISECSLVVAPVRIGGGIQNKILEGMALAKPVLTFRDRIKPFPGIIDGKHIVAVEADGEYGPALARLLDDRSSREEIGRNAREYIRAFFTWDKISSGIIEDI